MTDKIDHLVKIWRSENFGNFDLLTPFMAIVLFPVPLHRAQCLFILRKRVIDTYTYTQNLTELIWLYE